MLTQGEIGAGALDDQVDGADQVAPLRDFGLLTGGGVEADDLAEKRFRNRRR